MKNHCCTCGDKRPKNWRDEGWISIRADKDPAHQFCKKCRDSGTDTLKHVRQWRRGQLGCRIDEHKDTLLFNGVKAAEDGGTNGFKQ